MSICIVGDPHDLTAVYVGWLARRRGIEVVELFEDKLGSEWYFEFDDEHPSEGTLYATHSIHPFSAVSGAFVRLNPHPHLPEGVVLAPDEEATFLVERRHSLQHFLNSAPFAVANRPAAGRSNSSKPYQMRSLARAGFRIPQWVVTNDESTARKFESVCHQGMIYKSCSGLRSHVRRIDNELMDRMSSGTSPVIIQEYVEGRDVRVHTVQSRFFPTEVLSSDVDYRFDGQDSEFRATGIPQPLAERCCAYAKAEGLSVAGFDFRVTVDSDWYCLEMNPVPTFLPYEMATSQKIGDTIIDTLFSTAT